MGVRGLSKSRRSAAERTDGRFDRPLSYTHAQLTVWRVEHARTTRRTARRRTRHCHPGAGGGPLLREHGRGRDQGRTAVRGREPLSPGRQLPGPAGRRALLPVPRHEQDQALPRTRPAYGTRAVRDGEAPRGRGRVPHQRARGSAGTHGPSAHGPHRAVSEARGGPRQRFRSPRRRGGQGDARRRRAGARRDRQHERAAGSGAHASGLRDRRPCGRHAARPRLRHGAREPVPHRPGPDRADVVPRRATVAADVGTAALRHHGRAAVARGLAPPEHQGPLWGLPVQGRHSGAARRRHDGRGVVRLLDLLRQA